MKTEGIVTTSLSEEEVKAMKDALKKLAFRPRATKSGALAMAQRKYEDHAFKSLVYKHLAAAKKDKVEKWKAEQIKIHEEYMSLLALKEMASLP